MNILALTQPMRTRPVLGYAFAIALSFGALGIRFALGDLLAGFPFLTFFGAVTVVGFLAGLGPGALAAVISGLLADYYLIPPLNSLAVTWPSGWIAIGFYCLTTATIIALLHGMFRALEDREATQLELERLNAGLEKRVAERTAALQAEMHERVEAQNQLRQLQRMESLGQLTGGVAHDFNNMLAIVIGALDLAKRRLTGNEHPRLPVYLNNALEGAERAATLTARLLAFSRRQALAPQPLDANRLVSGMSEMLRRTLGSQIHVETVLAGGLWACFADAAQLENAIVNLAVNARDAMPEGGKLTIETANTDLDDRYVRAHADVEAGQYVMISVTDTGTGMAPDVIERAFDPFFTTKGTGRGTGLGLSQVFGFVKQSQGHVKIYSEIGQGTTVKLYMPRHMGAASPVVGSSETAIPSGRPDVVILVVDDEHAVRAVAVEALSDLGYTVAEAASGEEALRVMAEMPRLDLLFTDVVMPGMNGRQLADEATARKPGLRVLFTTGYTRNAVVHNGVLDPGVAFLPKPFTVESLAHKVAAALA